MSCELDAHVSISSKTNHATGVAINSGKLLRALMKIRGDIVTTCYGYVLLYTLAIDD